MAVTSPPRPHGSDAPSRGIGSGDRPPGVVTDRLFGCIALFVTEVAPRRLRKPTVYVIDLLAAIPSVVYGIWAIFVLLPALTDVFSSVSSATDGITVLGDLTADPSASGRSFMAAGIVV